MRPAAPVTPLVLGLVLLAGCSADPPAAAPSPPPTTAASTTTATAAPPTGASPPSAAADEIRGLELTPGLRPRHVDGPITYDQIPPVGGAHSTAWLRCEVYDTAVPAELAMHSLEHGAVWLTHEPSLAAPQVRRLAALHDLDATTREYVLVSPYDGLPSAVVAVAWGVTLAVDSADDPRLEQFVRRYAGGAQGGEPGVPCTSSPSALDAEQGAALIDAQR